MIQDLERYSGNMDVFIATLSTDEEDFTLVDKTIKMSIKIGANPVHTLTGNLIDEINHIVHFTPTTESVAYTGEGVWDIQVVTGSVPVVFDSGIIELLPTVTPQ